MTECAVGMQLRDMVNRANSITLQNHYTFAPVNKKLTCLNRAKR